MSTNKAVVKMIEGEEMVIKGQIPAPCFRCGICCTLYQPPLYPEDIENIALALGISKTECICRYAEHAPTKKGYLLKRMEKGCIFLVWDEEGKACCTIYSFRPKACREWIPSLSKPECLEGLIKLKSEGQLTLPGELYSSKRIRKRFARLLRKTFPVLAPSSSLSVSFAVI